MATLDEVRAVKDFLEPSAREHGMAIGIGAKDGENVIRLYGQTEDFPLSGTLNGVEIVYVGFIGIAVAQAAD